MKESPLSCITKFVGKASENKPSAQSRLRDWVPEGVRPTDYLLQLENWVQGCFPNRIVDFDDRKDDVTLEELAALVE